MFSPAAVTQWCVCSWLPFARSVIAAVKAQAEKAIHVQLTIVASEPIAELMQKLRDHVVPPELSRFFFNSTCSPRLEQGPLALTMCSPSAFPLPLPARVSLYS